MAKKRSLNVVPPEGTGLGLPTIMDRDLAARYGADYVHLAAFAIDVERVFQATDEDSPLPFGWEVHLTAAYVLDRLSALEDAHDEQLLEDACRGILKQRSKTPPLGGQLTFAVFCLHAHELLPQTLGTVFERWRAPPTELADELAALAQDPQLVPRLAQHCLTLPLEPPLSPPSREALVALADPETHGWQDLAET